MEDDIVYGYRRRGGGGGKWLLIGSMCGGAQAQAYEAQEIEQLPGQGSSHYSLSTGILPSLGRSNRRIKLRPFIVSPYGRRFRAWETFLVILVIYTAWVSPFEFGFLDKPKGPLSVMDNVVNGFFLVDIVLTFFVAYLEKNTYLLVDDPKKIAWKYTSSWLAFDVISTIPSELARKISPYQAYGLFNMLRLWRLRRVSTLFSRLEKDRNFNYFWVRCAKLICVTLFAVHSAGCFYYVLAAHYHDPGNTWIGKNMPDFLQQSLWIRYSKLRLDPRGAPAPSGPPLGPPLILVVHGTSKTRQFRDTIQAATSFAQRNELPPHIHEQMLSHLGLKFRTDSEGLQQQGTLDSLPKAIRSSIYNHLFYSLMDNVYLFRGVSGDLLFQLVSEMRAEYFPPKEDIILRNEAPTDFYILATGAVDLLVSEKGVEQVVGEAKAGELCGEISVLCYRPQLFTVRTKRLSQLLRLNRTTFLNIIQSNVGDGTIIMNNLLQHLKELNNPIMDGVLLETENMIARGRKDLPLTLCFAALRGDNLLLHHLLKRGLDPNESDNNGRTALHIAAFKGKENCVRLLLDFGADPNSRDLEGSVPLWEAIYSGHKPTIKLLSDKGATLTAGDVSLFSCTAAEQNNLDIMKEIVRHGGDVTRPKSNNASMPLHVAICEGNFEIVKFLLDQGANIDTPGESGLTARDLAEQQGHDNIKELFESYKSPKIDSAVTIPSNAGHGVRFMGKYKSDPAMVRVNRDDSCSGPDGSCGRSRPRRWTNSFSSSLFGFMSAAQTVERGFLPPTDKVAVGTYAARVRISCPDKGDLSGKLILLPDSFEELLEIGAKKYSFLHAKILSKDGAEIDGIELIRDGDHLVFASGDRIDENGR